MPAGVYLHIPFCKSRCSYCDFATDVYKNSEAIERYVSALCKEIKQCPHVSERTPVDTIYLGGGTPSLLTPDQVERILQSVNDKFNVSPDTEITMEMNPATVTPETLGAYKSLGVNRTSFGVQTFDDTELRRLARGHNAQDARDTFRMLRDAGFENISFDLIAGLPRQTLTDWERNLNEALRMHPEHLSLYLLEIHEGTPLAEQIRSERQPMPDDDLAAQMYERMLDITSSAGYEQYEISNFSLPGYRSRHNSKYWRLEPVYGFGVSAHSFDGSERYANERDTATYVRQVESFGSAEISRERINSASEFAFLNLRLNEGIDLGNYQQRFGQDITITHAADIERLYEADLIDIVGGRLFLTRRGMLFSNEVFTAFI
jgi:oxygen-independent coproporphyrinogen-3 oxidase